MGSATRIICEFRFPPRSNEFQLATWTLLRLDLIYSEFKKSAQSVNIPYLVASLIETQMSTVLERDLKTVLNDTDLKKKRQAITLIYQILPSIFLLFVLFSNL